MGRGNHVQFDDIINRDKFIGQVQAFLREMSRHSTFLHPIPSLIIWVKVTAEVIFPLLIRTNPSPREITATSTGPPDRFGAVRYTALQRGDIDHRFSHRCKLIL